MTTTLGRFADALGALAVVGANEQGRHLYLTGQSYERCQTDAERDGWGAAWNEDLEMQELLWLVQSAAQPAGRRGRR